MTPGPTTIDLGELPRGDAPAPDLRWSPHQRLRRWHRRGTWQAAGAAAVTVLLLLTAGAAGSTRPVLVHQYTIPVWNLALDQQYLYAIEDAAGGAGAVLVAYRLADGARQWESPLGTAADTTWPTVWDDTLLVMSYADDGGSTVTRVDPETGAPRWSHAGDPVWVGDGRLLLRRPSTGPTAEQDWPVPQHDLHDLIAIDLETGREAWTAELGATFTIDTTDPARLVALGAEGQLTSYDLVTGEPLATAQITQSESLNLSIIGSFVLVLDHQRHPQSLAAYDVDTVTERWSTDLTAVVAGAPGVTYHDPPWLQQCGPLVCLSGPVAVPRALDPATGEVVWSAGWLPAATGERWFSVARPESERLAGYLMLSRRSSWSEGGELTRWLIDARTGAMVLDLQGWQLSGGGVAGTGSPDPMLTRQDHRATWFGRLRPDLSGVDVLGMIDRPAPHQCRPLGSQVLCRVEPSEPNREPSEPDQGQVEIWQARW